MATPCSTPIRFQFQPRIALDFEGGALSSDAGLIVLRELDHRLGLTRCLEGLLEDSRNQLYVQHPLSDMIRQRLYQIAAGYEDAVDANLLRKDPTFQLVVHPERPGEPLASQPTLSRLENRATWQDINRLSNLSLEWFLRHGARLRQEENQEILLDADSTEDPTHGQQQLALFHGKYGTYMYQPLLIFEGRTGYLLASRLRPGTVPDAEGILPELQTAGAAAAQELPPGTDSLPRRCGLQRPGSLRLPRPRGHRLPDRDSGAHLLPALGDTHSGASQEALHAEPAASPDLLQLLLSRPNAGRGVAGFSSRWKSIRWERMCAA